MISGISMNRVHSDLYKDIFSSLMVTIYPVYYKHKDCILWRETKKKEGTVIHCGWYTLATKDHRTGPIPSLILTSHPWSSPGCHLILYQDNPDLMTTSSLVVSWVLMTIFSTLNLQTLQPSCWNHHWYLRQLIFMQKWKWDQ